MKTVSILLTVLFAGLACKNQDQKSETRQLTSSYGPIYKAGVDLSTYKDDDGNHVLMFLGAFSGEKLKPKSSEHTLYVLKDGSIVPKLFPGEKMGQWDEKHPMVCNGAYSDYCDIDLQKDGYVFEFKKSNPIKKQTDSLIDAGSRNSSGNQSIDPDSSSNRNQPVTDGALTGADADAATSPNGTESEPQPDVSAGNDSVAEKPASTNIVGDGGADRSDADNCTKPKPLDSAQCEIGNAQNKIMQLDVTSDAEKKAQAAKDACYALGLATSWAGLGKADDEAKAAEILNQIKNMQITARCTTSAQ